MTVQFKYFFFIIVIFPAFLSAQESFTLRYKSPSPSMLRYKRTEATKAQSQTQTGLSANIDRTTETFLQTTFEDSEDGKLTFHYLQDTAFVDEKSEQQGVDLQNILTKKRVQVVMSDQGVLIAAKPEVPLELPAILRQTINEGMLAKQAMIFPPLPQRALISEMTWNEHSADTSHPLQIYAGLGEGSGLRYVTTEISYKVDSILNLLGHTCVTLTWSSSIGVESKMIFRDTEIFNEETTTTHGTLYFDAVRGILVKLELDSEKNGTTAIFGKEPAIVPTTSKTKITIQLIP